MEKKVLLKDLVEFGSNVRKQIISKVRVSDEGLYPIGEIWDANTTLEMIVDGAHIEHETIRRLDEFAHAEATRAQSAENALRVDLNAEIANRISDVDAEEARAKSAEQALDQAKADKDSVYTKDEVYTKEEVNESVNDIVGDLGMRTVGAKDEYWTIGEDTTEYASDPTYQISTNFDYIHDEASWNESYANGGLKIYYEANPDEDRYNFNENRWAQARDKVNGEWPDYCPHCWQGAISAPGAKYPWIVVYFDTDVNSKLIFNYEGKNPVRPWGDRIFGNGNGHKVWGCASIPEELGNEFLLDNEGNTTFDVTKFQLILEHQDVVYHEADPGTQEPYTVKTYVDDAIAKIVAEMISGEIPYNSIGTEQIKDGDIQIEDLSDEIKEKLQTVVDEENENAYIG